jgi:hypothetical protein
LPVEKLEREPERSFLEPVLRLMPEKRWYTVAQIAVRGIVDFVSENREIYRAMRITRARFLSIPIHFVGDAGLVDQKLFAWAERANPSSSFAPATNVASRFITTV